MPLKCSGSSAQAGQLCSEGFGQGWETACCHAAWSLEEVPMQQEWPLFGI